MTRLALALLLLLAATGAQGQAVLNRGNGAEPDSLDPAFATTAMETNILGDLMVGLTTLDAAARPVPGIADHWETSRDGLTWTFHLRPARWSDGSKVTAQDFLAAWRRLLEPKTAARNAQNLWIIRNAQAITAGHLPSTALGATAPDPATVIITLEHPAPWLPELLTQPSALPLPPVALKNGPHPNAYVSDGPYRLASWVPNDHVTLVKNPGFYDAASVKIDTVNYFPTADTEAALRRFRAGELDMQTPLPSAQITWLKTNMPGALHIMPSLALAYLAINLRDPALADIRVRRALNLVYDREAVAEKVMKLGERPAYALVPPNVANYAGGPQLDFTPLPYPARLALAKRLMQDAGFGPFNKLTLSHATTGNPDSKRLAAVFQAMARQIYIDVRISVSDYALELRALRLGQYQLGYATWLADFDDASNFLDLLKSDSPGNYAGYRNPKFDAALEAAEREPDTGKRALLLKSAERIALADLPWLPIRFLSQSEVVAPRVGGYVPNARDYNRSRWLWIKK
ncbi:MAG TPA: peptide ABC transporter substrate-binding protein [Rhizomicrobium sp.]|jgi:oligopeptide transport system substrate-binding protein|nr:peptide ABC transporter substrate-binding protein [Rhizomicrobium sp.]